MSTAPLAAATVLGDYPHTAALKDGRVTSAWLTLEHRTYAPISSVFSTMVNELAFDVCEMAIATYLAARDHGVALTLLPVVLVGEFPHRFLITRRDSAVHAPADLVGARVGVRSYTVTTGMWMRAALAAQYGVDSTTIDWITIEEPHDRGYVNPANVHRAPPGSTMLELLRRGDIDAAVGGGEALREPDVRPVITDAVYAAQAWLDGQGYQPINHLVVVRSDLARARPEVVPELLRMFTEAGIAAAEPVSGGHRSGGSAVIGRAAVESALAGAIRFAADQQIIRRAVTVDDLLPHVAG